MREVVQAQPGGDADIAALAALLADPARCKVLLALDDGRALPASVLADEAGISRPTASSHLGKLTDAGLLRVETHGRHRYYRLAGPDVAHVLEALAGLAPSAPSVRTTSRPAGITRRSGYNSRRRSRRCRPWRRPSARGRPTRASS